jgi:hypothetical protein
MSNDESKKKKNQFHKKSSRKKTSQLGITRLTRYLVHEIEITLHKKKSKTNHKAQWLITKY